MEESTNWKSDKRRGRSRQGTQNAGPMWPEGDEASTTSQEPLSPQVSTNTTHHGLCCQKEVVQCTDAEEGLKT
jgi:hypothetical protein